jgi:hypothetical protein
VRESGDELWASVQDNYLRHPMVFPNLIKAQESCSFGIDGGMCGEEVCALVSGDTASTASQGCQGGP